MKFLYCFVLFVVFVVSSAITPPTFPSIFVTTFQGQGPEGRYNGTWWWDYENKRDKQETYSLVNSKMEHEVDIDRYDLEETNDQLQAYFFCEWLGQCTKWILVPPMRPFSVPSDSVYGGKVTVHGESCDHWTYTFDSQGHHWVTDYYVAQGDSFFYPLRIEYSGNQPHVIVDWTSFDVKTSIPESIFEVPSTWQCVFRDAPSRVEYPHVRYGLRSDTCPPVDNLL